MSTRAAHLEVAPHANGEGFQMVDGAAREQLRLAVRLLDAAEQRQHPIERSQALAQVARCFRLMAAYHQAEEYLLQALRWARMISGTDMAVELLCELAEVACMAAYAADNAEPDQHRKAHAALERARDHAFAAASAAAQVSDPQWEIKVLLRVSDVLDQCGDHDDALSMQTRALHLMHLQPASAEQMAEALNSAAPNQLM